MPSLLPQPSFFLACGKTVLRAVPVVSIMLASYTPSIMTQTDPVRSRLLAVFTDMHFWVPVAVLICGLLLLRLFH
jgi:hypothetical protein